MVSFDDLHTQNHQIAELAKVLNYLFEDREMCDTELACELFERYREKFEDHMDHNREIYSALYSGGGHEGGTTANRFMEGEREIKRVFHIYANRWCKRGLQIDDHGQFCRETEKMFQLVHDRIQAESEQLYPLARKAMATES